MGTIVEDAIQHTEEEILRVRKHLSELENDLEILYHERERENVKAYWAWRNRGNYDNS